MTRNQKIIDRASKFQRLENARNWASYGPKAKWVVMGDCATYLVVRPVDAARLEKAGYEIVI